MLSDSAHQPSGSTTAGGSVATSAVRPTESPVDSTAPIPTPYADPDALPELVALALQGNQRAWHDLVQRYSPLVSSVIRRFRMNDSDADDVRQNLWMRLVEHLKDIREPRALPGWVMTTTRNEAIRVLAGKRRTEPVDPQQDDRLDNIEHTEPDADLIRAEHRAAVHAGLRELRPEHRELIELTFADTPISYQQISTRLGIPIGSIGPTRARCLKKLERTAAIRALAS
jgi:RNA polymerase sigma factor (sigma-70 family)